MCAWRRCAGERVRSIYLAFEKKGTPSLLRVVTVILAILECPDVIVDEVVALTKGSGGDVFCALNLAETLGRAAVAVKRLGHVPFG